MYPHKDKNILAPADGVIVSIGNVCEDEKPFGDENIEVTAKDIQEIALNLMFIFSYKIELAFSHLLVSLSLFKIYVFQKSRGMKIMISV